MNIKDIQKITTPILKNRAVKRAAVFGSTARGDANPSDIDLLVEMSRPYGLFTFLSLKGELEDALSAKVDLVEYQSIKPAIKKMVLQDASRRYN